MSAKRVPSLKEVIFLENRLQVNLGGIILKNPLIAASGTYGYGREYERYYSPSLLGGISSKGITRYPKPGNSGIRIWETPSGIINSIGLENPGVEYFAQYVASEMNSLGTNVFINLGGNTVEEYVEGIEILNGVDCAAIELNISCPNVKHGGMAFGVEADAAYLVVKEVMAKTRHKVFVKLSPNARDIVEVAKAVEEGGATGISLVNTFLAMAIDVDKKCNVFDNGYAGLSGPAIKPIALRMVHQVCRAVSIPVIGMGGITNYRDVLEFLMAGATAVQVGTYHFMNPHAVPQLLKELDDYLKVKEECISDYIGLLL